MNKKGKIDGKICEIISSEEYYKNPTLYDPKFTAIEAEDGIYPIRTKTDNRPGFYQGSIVSFYKKPNEEFAQDYSKDNIINFDNIENTKDLIQKSMILKDMESEILTNPKNIFHPSISDTDEPAMAALKEAVNLKNIDINNYESRFGDNFNNEKREFNKSKITMGKLRTLSKALDIKATLILEDAGKDVPNPMNSKVIVEITGGEQDD